MSEDFSTIMLKSDVWKSKTTFTVEFTEYEMSSDFVIRLGSLQQTAGARALLEVRSMISV